jgi:hypothetical protein
MATFRTVRHRTPVGTYSERGLGVRLAAARVVRAAGSIAAGTLVLGIVLVVLEANRGTDVVGLVLDAARWLAGPFAGLFSLDARKAQIAVDWGVAAAVYSAAAHVIAGLLVRD